MADPIEDLGVLSGTLTPFENLSPNTCASIAKILSEVNDLKLKLSEALIANKNLREFHESVLAEIQEENRQLRLHVQNSSGANYSPTVVRRKISKRADLNLKNNVASNSIDINDDVAATYTIMDNNLNAVDINSVDNNLDFETSNAANISSTNNMTNDSVPVMSRFGPKKIKKKVIQAIDTSLENVLNIVKTTNCEGFSLKQNSIKSPIKISIDKPEEIHIIRDALKNNKVSFHEFKWESEKQQGFLIRGLVGISESSVPDVLDELIKAGVPASAKLSLFKTGFMRANPQMRHNPLLKLVAPPDFDTKTLKNIRYLDHVAISFEKIKSKSVVQCSNCQRLGHSAAGCQHAHRCVKCGENHLRDACPRTFNKGVKLVCCNCGGNHTANNLSVCSYFINNFGSKKPAVDVSSKSGSASATSKPPMPAIKRPTLSSRNAASTYADIVKESSAHQNTNNSNLSELSRKIDIIYHLVMKHEAALQDRIRHG